MIRPGADHVHNGAIWQVETTQLRGFAPDETKWAKLVRYDGQRLVNEVWIEITEEGDE